LKFRVAVSKAFRSFHSYNLSPVLVRIHAAGMVHVPLFSREGKSMKQFVQSGCAVMLLALLAGCGREVTVKIGVAAPMTGTLAEFGKDIAQGALVAVEELNAEQFRIDGRRVRFELVTVDDKASVEEGTAAARRLIDSGVVAVFGHFTSDVSIAAAPLYANAGIAQMSASTNPRYTRMGLKTTFRLAADDIEQGGALGRLVAEKLRPKSVFVLDDGSTFGRGLVEEALKVLKTKRIDPPRAMVEQGEAQQEQLLRRIRETNADLIFYAGDEVAGVPLLKFLRKSGVTATFVTGDGMCDEWSLKSAEGAADSNFYCSMAGIPPSWLSAGIGFTQLYQARFGKPGSYSPVAYDAIHILAQAMQRARSATPDRYLPELTKSAFDGKVQGAVEFDGKGDIKDGTIVIYRAVGGRLLEQKNLR
jgi:branched-chain amino acid transport system substrate-binding protein